MEIVNRREHNGRASMDSYGILVRIGTVWVLCCLVMASGCTGRMYIGYDRTDYINEHRQMDREGSRGQR